MQMATTNMTMTSTVPTATTTAHCHSCDCYCGTLKQSSNVCCGRSSGHAWSRVAVAAVVFRRRVALPGVVVVVRVSVRVVG